MSVRFTLMVVFSVTVAATAVHAKEGGQPVREHKAGADIFEFKTRKGDVCFDHDKHRLYMNKESCLPCHRTSTPTKEQVLKRLDQQTAHYFCKGCHNKAGRGPTRCHECHELKE